MQNYRYRRPVESANQGGRLRPDVWGTLILFFSSILITVYPSGDAYSMAYEAAWIMGIAIGITCLLEFKNNPANIIRVDVLMLVALYGLTLLEFLYPQPDFNFLVPADRMKPVNLVLAIGFTGIVIGRHFPFRRYDTSRIQRVEMTPKLLIGAMLLCAFIGYFHMLWAVQFNPVQLIEEMLGPRFSQSWTRGRFGGGAELLHELGLLIYLIPAAAGVVHARKSMFSGPQLLVTYALFFLTLLYGFSSGTRNIFATYVITYVCAYIISSPGITKIRIIRMGIVYSLILLAATQVILEFRKEGLANYIARISMEQKQESVDDTVSGTLFVDYNLLTLAQTTKYFPRQADYLGLEVPYWALIKPIPRALWQSKPQGLSVSIENVRGTRGAEAATWSATFLGEAYMAGGFASVGIAALFFGLLAAWWNKRFIASQSMYLNLLYASGIFAALISMRSLFWFTTAILPTLALIVYRQWFLRKRRFFTNETTGRT